MAKWVWLVGASVEVVGAVWWGSGVLYGCAVLYFGIYLDRVIRDAISMAVKKP